jgi:DNA-binding XRE family transcriptional regulator
MATASSSTHDLSNREPFGYTLPMGISSLRSQHKTTSALHVGERSTNISRLSRHVDLRPRFVQPIASNVNFVPTDVSSRFGARLRDLRRSHRLTQLDMAVAFGIDRSYISDVECGKKGISLATLEIIALGFSMKLSDLFEDL